MDTLKSIWEDFSDRFKSPFVISFALSWLAWNWEILYAASNFDPDYTMHDKMWYIKDYISNHLWTVLTWYPFGTSFLATCIFYLSKSVYLGLDSFYENKLRVFVIKKIGISKMVPSTDLEKYVKEVELERKERREQDAIHATLRSEKESLLTEIEGLKVENSRYHILEGKNAELRELNEQLSNTLRNNELEFPKDLSNFFSGHWVCEYQIVSKEEDIEIRSEIFLINEIEYRVNARTLFKIEGIAWNRRTQLLTFTRKGVGHTIKNYNIRLLKCNDSLWIGLEERQDASIVYVRLFPIGNLPNHYLSILDAEAANKFGVDGKNYRDSKHEQLYSILKSARNFS